MTEIPEEPLTEREALIMDEIWRLGEATAEQVRSGLPGEPHDSTVRTLLRVLVKKGFLKVEPRGKAYWYQPAVERHCAQKLAVGRLLSRFFGGSAESLVLRLIEDKQLTAEQLDELRRSHHDKSPSPKRRSRKGENR